ncbi:MAG: insulinase family protein [Firmicutes bacterium]|nr:insulinase family protein [Bacillota bacterium]
MQIIKNDKVKEKLYIERLSNGLTVMIIPKKNIQKKYVIWATNYGSIDNEFTQPGETEKTVVPDGIAHFLEHKMFEQENGTNSLDALTALGVNANAYTTNNHTAYLFECTDNFYPALDELMNYVQHPYFTDENVEKEKGIIGQEIMMYDDYPEWQVYMNAIKCMYKNNPVNLDIAGTIETISKIDKEVLYKCYNTFYRPSNMIMCFSGDFEPEKIVEEVRKRLVEDPPCTAGNALRASPLNQGGQEPPEK